jgi:hypothetical protein
MVWRPIPGRRLPRQAPGGGRSLATLAGGVRCVAGPNQSVEERRVSYLRVLFGDDGHPGVRRVWFDADE